MPWKEMELMSIREEFVQAARQAGSNIRQLCRQYHISPRTGYKWLKRYAEGGRAGLVDQSKRPQHSPRQTAERMEQLVLQKRAETGWGGRKIAKVLHDERHPGVPHPNTITDILRRHDQLDPQEASRHSASQRFQRQGPNELWQMDYKGHFALLNGRCHPLTLLDDHSRFCIGLRACADETGMGTQAQLTDIFRRYGLPLAILCDNGSPWGSGGPRGELTWLSVWLMRLGIRVLHGRPVHPQTQGKDERFHRTLKAEVLQGAAFADLTDCQRHFDPFRDRYNLIRPHEALGMDTPAQHYQPSPLSFPEVLPVEEYDSGQTTRKVQDGGLITFRNCEFRVGRALRSHRVRIAPTETDGTFDVFFCTSWVAQICFNNGQP